jgi:nicotinamidase-related amidase
MTTPKTLLEMSGADLKPPPLSASALVIIDAQNEYLDGKLALPDVRPAVDALARLLAKARAAGAPVVHIQHKGRAGGLFDLDARGGAIIDAAMPASGEHLVQKPLPNAFAQTGLDAT